DVPGAGVSLRAPLLRTEAAGPPLQTRGCTSGGPFLVQAVQLVGHRGREGGVVDVGVHLHDPDPSVERTPERTEESGVRLGIV
ncbi:MAG: hypothetical protein AVDCRST_MAG87-2460, partial [uncultured Thermomicrobiales bacterium]